jgi:hypothetical protein
LRKRVAGIATSILLLLCAPRVAAQPNAANAAAAESLFQEAEALIAEGQYTPACAKLAESQRLDPQLGTLLHLADCYERNDQAASAWATFREAAELAKQRGDARERVAIARSEALVPKLATLAIVVPEENATPGLQVERDGQVVSPSVWGTAVPVDPGKIHVRAHAAGYDPWTEEVEVRGAGKTVVRVPRLVASAKAAKAPPPDTRPSQPPPSSSAGPSWKTIGLIGGGVGVAVLGVGAALSGIAVSQADDANTICPTGKRCTNDEITRYNAKYDDAESLATAGPILIGIGSALLVGGLAIAFFGPSSRSTAVLRTRGLSW